MSAVSARPLAIRPGSARAWVLACRPATLTAAAGPVLVGAAIAYQAGSRAWGPALAALMGAMLLQITSNLANDVYDHEKGADTADRKGPLRAAQAGLLTPSALRAGLGLTIGLAFLPGLYLAWVGGWSIVAIGLLSILCAVAYTGGPYPLGYHGLGDLFVFVFFGLVAVAGTSLVMLGEVPPLAWVGGTAVGALATAILVVNNVRDRETDVVAGKRTLAVRFGRRAGIVEYWGLLALAWAAPLVVRAYLERSQAPQPGLALLPLATLPMGLRLGRVVATQTEGPPLNEALRGTAKLLFVYAALFALGLILAGQG